MQILARTLSRGGLLPVILTAFALGGLLPEQNPPDKPSDQPADQGQEPVHRSGTKVGTRPRLIHNVVPQYSDKARRAKLEGTVVLSLVVDSSGNPTLIK